MQRRFLPLYLGLFALAVLALGANRPAKAAYIVNLDEVGSTVVATGSGTIDLTDLTIANHASSGAFIDAAGGDIILGGNVNGVADDRYAGFTGPTSFGSGSLVNPISGTGDRVGVDQTLGQLILQSGYTSGTFLADTTTYFGTFAIDGLTPGTYVWTWGSGADADSFTLQIGPSTVPVPEPSSALVLLGALAGLMGLSQFQRRAS